MQRINIPYLSLDWLVMGFTNGIPEYGIHDKLFPHEIADRLWDFLCAMCESMLWSGADCIIEGEAILPHLINPLLEDHPDDIKICFMGYTDVDVDEKVRTIKTYGGGPGDWLVDESDEYVYDHVKNMIAHSLLVREGCGRYGLRYFDTSDDFLDTIDRVVDYLIND